jgi:hypothetical protein
MGANANVAAKKTVVAHFEGCDSFGATIFGGVLALAGRLIMGLQATTPKESSTSAHAANFTAHRREETTDMFLMESRRQLASFCVSLYRH